MSSCGLRPSSRGWAGLSRIAYDEHSDLVGADPEARVEQGVVACLLARAGLGEPGRAHPAACAGRQEEPRGALECHLMVRRVAIGVRAIGVRAIGVGAIGVGHVATLGAVRDADVI